MSSLRYNRVFKRGIAAIAFCFLLFGSIFVFGIVSKVQYDALVANMIATEATVADIDWDLHVRGPDEQEIEITYEVDGITYQRELETDTKLSFSAGTGANYSVGDKIKIFYDPQNPETIATYRSVIVGYRYMAIAVVGLALITFALVLALKNRRRYLVTQEEYEKEKETEKRSKAKQKEIKKQMRMEKRKKNAKMRKIIKIFLMILAIPIGLFVLFLLFGALLMALGY